MGEPSEVERRAALVSALAGKPLSRSPKLSELLTYICDEGRVGHPEQLTEREIGVAVFDRPEHYDSNADNIVRVQARNLRKRLETYYRSEGAKDPVRIRIPKGHYLPQFVSRDAPEHGAPEAERQRASTWLWVAAVVSAFLLGALGRQSAEPPFSPDTPRTSPLWDMVFSPGSDPLIVIPDTTFALSQKLLGRSLGLSEYLSAGVESPGRARAAVPSERTGPLAPVLRHVTWREQTDFGDVLHAQELIGLARARGAAPTIGFPRRLHTRDFKGRNVVLLGSLRANPWIELFEPNLNFVFRYDDEEDTPYIVNRRPLSEEAAEYRRGRSSDGSDETYAVVALAANLSGEGHALLISGCDDAGSDAAGDLLFSDALCERLVAGLGIRSGDDLPHFEALLRASRMEGSGSGVEIVTVRRLEGGEPAERSESELSVSRAGGPPSPAP